VCLIASTGPALFWRGRKSGGKALSCAGVASTCLLARNDDQPLE
jgi:hypothetical protein